MKKFLILLILSLSAWAQTPTPRPEPSATTYGVDELSLFPTYTRASFKAVFGKEAPAFDVTKAPKFWFDITPGTTKMYNTLSGAVVTPLGLTQVEASSVNIPDISQPQYPGSFQVVDDKVRYTSQVDLDVWLQSFVSNTEGNVNKSILIDPVGLGNQIPAQAAYLCSFLKTNDQTFHGGIDPACNNPQPLIAKYTNVLVGWAMQAAKIQDLMGMVPGTPCKYCDAVAKPAVGTPIRPLFPDETLTASMMGGVMVTRTSSGVGGFTDADRSLLKAIASKLGVQ